MLHPLLLLVYVCRAIFVHTDTRETSNCVYSEILINKPNERLNADDICVCEHTWSLKAYGLDDADCPTSQNGCALEDCLGGGWCPVSNLHCSTAEDREINVTPCDDLTPVHGDCGHPYCSCENHSDCPGFSFCAAECYQGDCSQETSCQGICMVCQPCEMCGNTSALHTTGVACDEHCGDSVTRTVPHNHEYQNTILLLSEAEQISRLREDCFTECLNNDECKKIRQTTDAYLYIFPDEQFCSFGTGCQPFFGTNVNRPFPGMEAEHWRIVSMNGEIRSYDCHSTEDCGAENPNCCMSPFDQRAICAKGDSVHCRDDNCVGKERYCDNKKGSRTCFPEDVSCFENIASWQPVLIVLGIVAVLSLKFFMAKQKEWSEKEGLSHKPYYVCYDRTAFLTGPVTFPTHPPRPKWKFLYDAESTFFLFADLTSSALSQSVPGAIGLCLLTALISWFRVYSTLSDSPDWLDEETIVSQTNALAEILGTMQTYVAFLLVFMLINRLTWFFSVLGNMYTVQGDIASLAMLIGARVKDREILFRTYRFLNLVHCFLHMETANHLGEGISTQDLVECGLLTRDEKKIMDGSWSKVTLATKWVGTVITNNFKGDDKIQIEREYSGLRNAQMRTVKCLKQTIPYSMVQLVVFLTYVWLLLLPPSMYSRMTKNSEYAEFALYPLFATAFVSLPFQAILKLILSLAVPTGKDLDDVNPGALLIETDQNLLVFLGDQDGDVDESETERIQESLRRKKRFTEMVEVVSPYSTPSGGSGTRKDSFDEGVFNSSEFSKQPAKKI